jgi:hypothetical protein
MMTITLGAGLALSATQWVPSLELLSYSNRRIVGSELGYVFLPPWYAGTMVFRTCSGQHMTQRYSLCLLRSAYRTIIFSISASLRLCLSGLASTEGDGKKTKNGLDGSVRRAG